MRYFAPRCRLSGPWTPWLEVTEATPRCRLHKSPFNDQRLNWGWGWCMSKVTFQLRYDGPALSEHGMDVADLASALLALGELIKRANATFNGEAARVNLVVQSDFEHKCFQINLELIQSILSSIGSLLTDEHALKNAQTIASWLGLIGLPPTVFGLFKYLARRKGNEIESVSPVLQIGITKQRFRQLILTVRLP